MFQYLNGILETLGHLGWLGAAVAAIAAAVAYLNNKRLEYQRSFNDKTLKLIFLTAETVGELVACGNEIEWEKQKERFWELYWGRLVLFESDETRKAMETLGIELKVMNFAGRWELHSQAYDVSKSLRNYLKNKNTNDWRITIDEIKKPGA
jgi:hypothetical protein